MPTTVGLRRSKDAGDAAEAAAICAGWCEFDEDFIALHGAVNLVGWNKYVVIFSGALAGIGANEAVAVAMEIEAASEKVVPGCARFLLGNCPMFAIAFDEVATRGDAS